MQDQPKLDCLIVCNTVGLSEMITGTGKYTRQPAEKSICSKEKRKIMDMNRDRLVVTNLGLIEDLFHDRLMLEGMLEDLIQRFNEETRLREHHRAYLEVRAVAQNKCHEYAHCLEALKKKWENVGFQDMDLEEVAHRWEQKRSD